MFSIAIITIRLQAICYVLRCIKLLLLFWDFAWVISTFSRKIALLPEHSFFYPDFRPSKIFPYVFLYNIAGRLNLACRLYTPDKPDKLVCIYFYDNFPTLTLFANNQILFVSIWSVLCLKRLRECVMQRQRYQSTKRYICIPIACIQAIDSWNSSRIIRVT